jgi:hypothetical protein
MGKVNELFVYDNFNRVPVEEVAAGDICALTGIQDISVGGGVGGVGWGGGLVVGVVGGGAWWAAWSSVLSLGAVCAVCLLCRPAPSY